MSPTNGRKSPRIVHVITGLNVGGAEKLLLGILTHAPRDRFQPEVVSLIGEGPLSGEVRQRGVPLHSLDLRRGVPDPGSVLRLTALLRRLKPDVVQTWMYHADLIGGVAARLAGVKRIAWSLHSSDLDPARVRKTTQLTVRLCARLSHSVPRKICATARRAIETHTAMGYDPAKFVHIPNGFDTVACHPDPELRAIVRAELGVPPEAPLIGMTARFDPQKDHHNFVQAAEKLARTHPSVRFLLCGPDVTEENAELTGWLDGAGVRDRFLLLGSRSDVPRLLTALDVGTLSSRYGETFPLAIGETMAAGVPCVVTDVGDTPELVGKTGRVVPPADPEALANAWGELLALPPDARRTLGESARARVVAHFEIRQIAARYADLHESLLTEG